MRINNAAAAREQPTHFAALALCSLDTELEVAKLLRELNPLASLQQNPSAFDSESAVLRCNLF